MKLKRSDKQYIEVEEFADYELTQCISYEMAARDWHYKDLADGVVNFYNHNKTSIEYYLQRDTYIENDTDKVMQGLENISELNSLIGEIDLIQLEGIFIGYKDPRLGKEFWDIKNIIDNHYGYSEDYPYQNIELIRSQVYDDINVINRQYREGYFIETELSTPEDDCIIPIDEEDDLGEEGKSVSSIEEYAKYINDDGILNDYSTVSNIRIVEMFKRPLVQVEELKTLNPELTVNLNRPLNEIIALIAHIKEDIEKNNLLKLPIELLGMKLKKADNLVCNDKGEQCFDPRSILSKQQKMADMFYIYDSLKLGYTQREIQNEVYNYYADKGLNITLDPGTLRKYRDIAMEYIVTGKYKEMLTGIKINEFNYRFG